MSCDSCADLLLTPTAGGKPIAIYTDGWEFHRRRLATDARQRMALQRSGRFLFWSLNWDDVVETLPSPQAPLDPNGLKLGMNPLFNSQPEVFLNRWWPKELRTRALVIPGEAQTMGSLALLMAYLAEPSEALWQGMAQQLALAQVPKQVDQPKSAKPSPRAICKDMWRNGATMTPAVEFWASSSSSAVAFSVLGLVDLGLPALNSSKRPGVNGSGLATCSNSCPMG